LFIIAKYYTIKKKLRYDIIPILKLGPSWSRFYCSWIYNYPSNQCLSPLKLWVTITFVSDLRHVGGFLQIVRFPPPIKLTATI